MGRRYLPAFALSFYPTEAAERYGIIFYSARRLGNFRQGVRQDEPRFSGEVEVAGINTASLRLDFPLIHLPSWCCVGYIQWRKKFPITRMWVWRRTRRDDWPLTARQNDTLRRFLPLFLSMMLPQVTPTQFTFIMSILVINDCLIHKRLWRMDRPPTYFVVSLVRLRLDSTKWFETAYFVHYHGYV